jgi:myo-inositol-1-phosphate synthase
LDKLGVFTVGMGAVATTLFAGVEMIRLGLRPAVGSFTQIGSLADAEGRIRPVREALALAPLEALVFGGVDLIETDALSSARTAAVLTPADIDRVSAFLGGISAGPGIHDSSYVRPLTATRVRPERRKVEQVEAMKRVYADFFSHAGVARAVVLLTLSTEAWRSAGPVHATVESFRAGLLADHPDISPSQIYAWAAVEAGFPVVNCTPNVVLEVPALMELAIERGIPIAGSDLKSGQTLLKTVIAGGLSRRLLGVKGWYSTNILGNRDGFVLEEPANFRAKEISKGSVLTDIFDANVHPELYGSLVHQVHINYFPPKGDNKESWDAIQLFGWLGYDMELKVNFQCRDSVLAAPLVLDLALLMDLASRRRSGGAQEWLGAFFKSPATLPGGCPSNDLSKQFTAMEEKLRSWL